MENKVKILLKEVQTVSNKVMQQESVWLFVNSGYRSENKQALKNTKQVYPIACKATRGQCWRNPLTFWAKCTPSSTSKPHPNMRILMDNLVNTLDWFRLDIKPHHKKYNNVKHSIWGYFSWGVYSFYKTLYPHKMRSLQYSYRVSGCFNEETNVHLPLEKAQGPRLDRYQLKFKCRGI